MTDPLRERLAKILAAARPSIDFPAWGPMERDRDHWREIADALLASEEWQAREAVVEALTKIMPSIVLLHGPIGGPWLDTWECEARAALARANTIAEAERVIIWRGSGSDLATDVAEILLDPTAARTDELGRFLDKWIKLIPPRDGVRRGRGEKG